MIESRFGGLGLLLRQGLRFGTLQKGHVEPQSPKPLRAGGSFPSGSMPAQECVAWSGLRADCLQLFQGWRVMGFVGFVGFAGFIGFTAQKRGVG